jgi:hypothetical protein
MYTSLGEIRRGWGKNVYAAGRDTLPLNAFTRRLLPFVFPIPALMPAVPAIVLLLAFLGVLGDGARLFGIGRPRREPALLGRRVRVRPPESALGAAASARKRGVRVDLREAAWKGSRVEWKGRRYESEGENDDGSRRRVEGEVRHTMRVG